MKMKELIEHLKSYEPFMSVRVVLILKIQEPTID
jgi:hypothetical protein